MLKRKGRAGTSPGPIPGYTDLDEIGGGAFATVYKATEEATGRHVALKVLRVDTVHGSLLETFARETQALARVSDHPNIVTLYRPLSAPDGRPVLVLELCRESVAAQLRVGGPMSPSAVTRVGIKMAGALETAHRNGFLHRDLKPQNILITQFGQPALADFGVAALQASAQASSGLFGFTTVHVAPEMLEGLPTSGATDVYGLASTMYQMLTGAPPFAAFESEPPASVILRIIRDPARPLRSEEIPLGLSDLLQDSLAKRPEDRPASALEFAQALQAVETSIGWPMTSFVVWGDEPLTTVNGQSFRPHNDESSAWLAATIAAATEAAVSGHRAVSAQPSPPLPHPPLRPPESLPTPSEEIASLPPLAPDPPPARRGPSIETPESAPRHVVDPSAAQRGQPSPPVQTPPVPLQPLDRSALDPAPAPPTPHFVDPESPPSQISLVAGLSNHSAESVYESTMQIGQLFAGGSRPDPASVEAASGRKTGIPVAVWAGIGAGLLVLIAALLLVLGVI